MKVRVQIIEDEKLIRWSLRQKFEAQGWQVAEFENGADALKSFENETYDLIMLDYKLPDLTGLEILREVRKDDADVVVIMMTAYSSIENAVDAMKLGAYDYITKPFDMEELLRKAEKALETTKLRREVRELRRHLQHEYGLERLIGESPKMADLRDVIKRIAAAGASTVFLRGESGTGKDLVARIIHYNSDRAPRPFMNITCTALSESLLESELFGHEKGAFTDAKLTKKGLFELADGGTIFLDEVGDMPPNLQAKLLRFLEDRMFRRVGGTQEIGVDVRVIAATNRDIDQAVKNGAFRSDLLFRLNVIPIYLPPVRERESDVILLARHYVTQLATEFRKAITRIEPGVDRKLLSYSWPGNVRELRNAIERAVLLSTSDAIKPEDIVLGRADRTAEEQDGFVLPAQGIDLHAVENQFVRQALARTNDNQSQAAKLLHISRDALRYRMEKLGLL